MLPVDYLVTNSLNFSNGLLEYEVVEVIFWEWEGVDAGPKTTKLYAEEVFVRKLSFGMAPWESLRVKDPVGFCRCKAVAQGDALSIIGGGDSVKALNRVVIRSSHHEYGGGSNFWNRNWV